MEHNLSCSTFNDKLKMYKQSTTKRTAWYSHRVFTDSSEKQAVEQLDIKHVETNKLRDGNDLAMILSIIDNQTNPSNQQIKVSFGTLTRIKQQDNMSAKRTTKRKPNTMSVDDSVLTTL